MGKDICILFSLKFWTPVRREVFKEVLPRLRHRRGALLYLVMYDLAWRSKKLRVRANLTDFSRWTGLEVRTIRKCIDELQSEGFIVLVHGGRLRSRERKPRWRVPLAEFDFSKKGPWTPVPRFILQRYFRAYPKSVLLVILLWHQHIGWHNDCWPGVARLALRTGWSRRAVYNGLNSMGHRHRWAKLRTGLPWPLEISYRQSRSGREVRHFRVRFYNYHRKKSLGHSVVALDQEFRNFFKLEKAIHSFQLDDNNEGF